MEDLTDSERRALRPIGLSEAEVAARTGRLLTEASGRIDVEVFTDVERAPISHTIRTDRRLLLIGSVAWPPGTYSTTVDGGVLCDDTYIGQSIRPLVRMVRRCQRTIAPSRHVGAVLVVHHSLPAPPVLPAIDAPELHWLLPHDLPAHLTRILAPDGLLSI